MTNPLDLEYKYRVQVTGALQLLPFTLAKKATTYPANCIFHPKDAAQRDSNLCWKCTEALRADLTTITDRWSDLEDGLRPGSGSAAGERVSGTGNLYPPLPINIAVSDAMGKARSVVWSVVGQLIQDRPSAKMPSDHGTGSLAGWLARWHVEYLAAHPSIGHCEISVNEIAAAAAVVKENAFESQTAEVKTTALCHQHTEDGTGGRVPCPGQIVGVQLPSGSKVVECTHDPLHRVPADVYFQVQARRDAYRKRAVAKLQRKYSAKVRRA